MLGAIQPGDLIVSQPHDQAVAHFGELSAEAAKLRGAGGVVILTDGGVRDIDYILKLGFPVFARYQTPKDIIGRWMLEEFNVAILIGDTPNRAGRLYRRRSRWRAGHTTPGRGAGGHDGGRSSTHRKPGQESGAGRRRTPRSL